MLVGGGLVLNTTFLLTTVARDLTYAGLVMNGKTSISNSIVISCSTSSCKVFNRLCRCPTNVRRGKAVHSVCS